MVPTEDRATEWTRTSSQSTIISISPSTATTSANTIYKGFGSPSPSFQDRRRVSTVSTNLERSLEGRRVSTNSTNLERRRVSTSSGTRRLLANFTSNFSNNTSNSSRLSDFSLARSKRGSKRRKSYAGSKCMYEVNRFPFIQSYLDCLSAASLWQALWSTDSQWIYYKVILLLSAKLSDILIQLNWAGRRPQRKEKRKDDSTSTTWDSLWRISWRKSQWRKPSQIMFHFSYTFVFLRCFMCLSELK